MAVESEESDKFKVHLLPLWHMEDIQVEIYALLICISNFNSNEKISQAETLLG